MQERDIFIKAIQEDDPHKRAAVLDMSCRGDANLRQRVEQLLAEHQREERFILDDPPITPDAAVIEPFFELTGTVIGRYELAELIGEGGFGVVYVAEQTTPVRRQVALKIIKPGMDSRQVLARFEAERQTLALMDHPHIAKILDGGTTNSGRPYFVMELVKGVPVTDYCDRCQLGTRERLELFVSVCKAVQHAHEKRIIHRDLKPSNVLVEMQDGRPAPKIIDFGVAKAIGQELTEQTLRTQFTQMIGTPMYMSPEQAELSPIDVDTRTDVYSLGVLLYELLTGQTPYTNARLSEASFDELRRIIREEEPQRPSARVSTLAADASTTLVETHRIDSGRLARQLRGELDWIVMKALAKDRTRRFATANELADDIERYLHHEPVLARPTSAVYRIRKFVMRNRSLAVSLSVGFVALTCGLVLATTGLITAQKRLAEVTAEQEDNEVLIGLLRDMYGIPWGAEALHQQSTMLDSRERLEDDLEQRLRGHPKVEIQIRQILAGTYRRSGEHDKARRHLERALQLAEDVNGPGHEQVADVLTDLADEIQWPRAHGPYNPLWSKEYAERALAIYTQLGIKKHHTAHAWFCLARSVQGDADDDAERYLRTALRIVRELANSHDDNRQVFAMWDLAMHLAGYDGEKSKEALTLIDQAIAMSRRVNGEQGTLTASVLAGRGGCLRRQGDTLGAAASYHEALDIYWQNGLEKEPRGHRIALSLAELYYVSHQHQKATEILEKLQRICGDHEVWDSLAYCLFLQGWGHLLHEDYSAAEKCLRDALQLASKHLDPTHEMNAYPAFYLAKVQEQLGNTQQAQVMFKAIVQFTRPLAELDYASNPTYYGHAWAILHQANPDNQQLLEALRTAEKGCARVGAHGYTRQEPHFLLVKAIAQFRLGDTQQAIKTLEAALDKCDFAYPTLRTHNLGVPQSCHELETALAAYLVKEQRVDDAEMVYERGIAARDLLADNDLQVALAELRFGKFLRELQRFECAKEQLLRAQQKLSTNPEAVDANRAQVATQLVALYTALEKPAEADRWQAEVDELNQRINKSENATSNRTQDRANADQKQN